VGYLPRVFGLSGDGHHNEIHKFLIDPATAAFTSVFVFTWN